MSVNVSVIDGRVRIGGDTYPHLAKLRELPGARWNDVGRVWTAPATPFVIKAIRDSGMGLPLNGDTSPLLEALFPLLQRLGRIDPVLPKRTVFQPWKHQACAYSFSWEAFASYLAIVMGGGKTKVVIDIVNNVDDIKTVLILCPVTVMDVWLREVSKHGVGLWASVALNHSTAAKKIEAAEYTITEFHQGVRYIIVNYESARAGAVKKWLLSQRWDLVVADEAHRAKGLGATGKMMFELSSRAGMRVCLSGTPMPHSPLDIFAQYRFLDCGIFGTNFTKFRDRFAIVNKMFPSQVVKWINQDEFQQKLSLMMYQVGPEVLDLPPILHVTRSCRLASNTQRIYDEFESEMVASIGKDEITAANALVKVLRLQQIACGHVADVDTGNEWDLSEEKADLLADLLEDIGPDQKVVVFARFRRDLRNILRVGNKLGRKCGELSGQQNDLIEAKYPEHLNLLAVQWQSGGVGVDLTAARYGICYSIDWSGGGYEQAIARVHRPGQERPVEFFHLLAEGTIDYDIYDSVQKKLSVVETILKRLRQRVAA